MTERLQSRGSPRRTARGRAPRSRPGGLWGARTIPAATAERMAVEDEPTLFGLPAEVPEAGRPAAVPTPRAVPPPRGLSVLRRADPLGAAALVLAGVAANVSLSLSWSPGDGPSGLSLVQRGGETLDAGIAETARSGVWPPLVVVLSGGLLVLLGFLLLAPARAHRLLGVLALAVALAAAAAVIVLAADAGWRADAFGPGLWCAIAVPVLGVLGVLGALKAMLTAPLVTLDPS